MVAVRHIREERREPKDLSQNDLINFLRFAFATVLRGSMSALSFPKLPGDVKD